MAVGDAHVFPGFLTPVLTRISFQSHRLLFSHASAEVRGGNTPGKNFTSTKHQTHNHQVMNPTRSPLSHPGGGFPVVLLTSTTHNILSKPLAAFPCNHCRNNGQRRERNESCRNDYHQSSERTLADLVIEPVTSVLKSATLLTELSLENGRLLVQIPGSVYMFSRIDNSPFDSIHSHLPPLIVVL